MNASEAIPAGGGSHVLIRNARRADERAVDVLLSTYFLDRDGTDISDFIVAEKIVAETRGKLVGVLACTDEPVPEIHSVAVHASYRGRGIGSSLLAHALGRYGSTVYVRTTAPGFFLKQGFSEVRDLKKEDIWEDCRRCNHRETCAQHFLRHIGGNGGC
jgi:amino-acid N-acetyltransferase